MLATEKIEVGDVVQLNEQMGPDQAGWIGAFLIVEEVRSWGVIGFVHSLKTHKESSRAYIRLTWEKVDRIGKAALVPGEVESPTEAT